MEDEDSDRAGHLHTDDESDDLEGGNDDGNGIGNDGGDSDGERAPQESCSYSRSMHRGRLLG